MKALYIEGFNSREDVEEKFRVSLPPTIEILIAIYRQHDYEGYAHVLYADRSTTPAELYDVHGSHCSCYGLEGQWEPKPITFREYLADVRMGKTWDWQYSDIARAEIETWIKGIIAESQTATAPQ